MVDDIPARHLDTSIGKIARPDPRRRNMMGYGTRKIAGAAAHVDYARRRQLHLTQDIDRGRA
jgi:hypothetical protein